MFADVSLRVSFLRGGGKDLFTIVAVSVFQERGYMHQGTGEGSCWQ